MFVCVCQVIDMPEVPKGAATEQLSVTLGWEKKKYSTLHAEAFPCWIRLHPMHFQPILICQQFPML